MTPGELKFTFMTFVFSVTLGLVISTFEVGPVSWQHGVLKFGYTIPALLLMVDMWIHYSRCHESGKSAYEAPELFLDTALLTCMYVSLGTLKSVPAGGTTDFTAWPPTGFWVWLIVYSVLKIYRGRNMLSPKFKGKSGLSWYSVLHLLLLVLIVLGWCWQAGKLPVPAGVPFWTSGVIFSVIVLAYLVIVYRCEQDPLQPIRSPKT